MTNEIVSPPERIYKTSEKLRRYKNQWLKEWRKKNHDKALAQSRQSHERRQDQGVGVWKNSE